LCSSGSVEVGGAPSATDFEVGPVDELPPLGLAPGGPRDRTPSKAGLNRSASLLETPGFAILGSANGCGFVSALLGFGVGLVESFEGVSSGEIFRVRTESKLPDIVAGFDGSGGLDALVGGLDGFGGATGFDFNSFILLIRAIASGVEPSFFEAGAESLELCDR
jgi:hypothetical protein